MKHYTDDKSLLDDAVVTPSFQKHIEKYKLGNYDEETAKVTNKGKIEATIIGSLLWNKVQKKHR